MHDLVGLYRVKNEEQWMERSLKSLVNAVDKIVVFDDHSVDKTEEICKSFDKVIWVPSPFDTTLDEVRDKNYIVQYAIKECKPLWFMCLDGDEELEPGGDVRLRAFVDKMINSKMAPDMVHFKFLYMWDKSDMVRHDGLYSRFISPRLWKVGYDHTKCVFKYMSSKVGFHCGWVPTDMGESIPIKSKLHILHWGNFTPEIRRHKYVWYNIKDPNDFHEDRYRHIVGAGRGYMYAGNEIELVPLSELLDAD